MSTTERRALSLKTGTWSGALPALDSPRTLVLAFGASSLIDAPDTWRQLHTKYPQSHVVGCSTAGEINGNVVQDDSIAVAVTRFEHTDLQVEHVRVADAGTSYDAGRTLGAALARRPGLRAVFVLSEGLAVNGSELVRGCNETVGAGVIVTGGLSGDGSRFERTWVGVGDTIASGIVAAVGFFGDHIVVTHGSRGGWDQFGPERVITRSTSNVIHEIDGQPALLLYKKYLGDKAKDLPGSGLLFPLQIRRDETDERPLVRTLLAVDEASQSLTFAGDTPQGFRVRLMKANFDRLVKGAGDAADTIRMSLAEHDVQSPAHLAVAISCVGRRLVLGARTDEEIEATTRVLPRGTELVGFYSYGELSPHVRGAACELHNQTMTLTVFSESPHPIARSTGATATAPAPSTTATMAATPLPQPPAPTAVLPLPPITDLTSSSSSSSPSPPPLPPPLAAVLPAPSPPPPVVASAPAAPAASKAMSTVPVATPGGFGMPTETATRTPTRSKTAAAATSTSLRPAPRTDAGLRSVRPAAFVPSRGAAAHARVVSRRVGSVTVVGISGKLAEGFKGRDTARELSGTVVLDLFGVERVTSYGVREWLAFLEELGPRVPQLFLVRCSEAVVAQLGMIRGFAGKGAVLSCLAPFSCTCGAPCNGLVDLRLHGRDIARGDVPSPVCPTCGNDTTQFDDDPRAYFVFQSDRIPAVPPEVDEAIAQLDARAVEAVEKSVDANGTRITVNAELDASIRWPRVLDGVEGAIVLDLQRSPRSTADGSVALGNALRSLLGPHDRVEIVAAPQELVQLVRTWPPSAARLVLQSAWVEGFCADCNGDRRVLVNVADHEDVLRAGGQPALPCPRHGRPLDFSRTRPALALLVPPTPPSPPTTPAAATARAAPATTTTATTTTATPTTATTTTATPTTATTPTPGPVPRPASPALWAVIGGLSVALAVSLVQRPATGPATTTTTTTAAAAPGGATAAGAATPEDDLPPGWAGVPLTREGAAVWVVGKAGPSRSKEQLLEAATDDAVRRLVAHIEREARGATVAAIDDPEAFVQRLRRRFDDTWAVRLPLERADVFVRERSDGFVGSFRFRVPALAVDEMKAELARTVTVDGLTVGAIRLTEAVALQADEAFIVTDVAGAAGVTGARVGDRIVRVGDAAVRSLPELEGRLRKGSSDGALSVVVHREGGQAVLPWRKSTQP
jgi:hypothetical protein